MQRMSELEELLGKDVLLMQKGVNKKKWIHRGIYRVERIGIYDLTLRKYESGYFESIPMFELRNESSILVTNGIRVTFPKNTDYRAVMRSIVSMAGKNERG